MNNRIGAALLLMWISLPGVAGELVKHERALPGRYLVLLKSETVAAAQEQSLPRQSLAQEARSLAATHGGRAGEVYAHALRGFAFFGTERAARALANDPRVAIVEQDQEVELYATQALPHWGLDRIDERDRPRNNHYTYTNTGAGVNLYIIDTGIAADGEFGARRVNAFTAITSANGTPLYDDCNGHGTQVAYLAGGTYSGVARNATLHNVRVGSICRSDCGPIGGGPPENPSLSSITGLCELTQMDVISGMNWVAGNRVKPAVANVSLGAYNSVVFDAAVTGMINAGVTVVVAAGNQGGNACTFSPGRVAAAVTVGASDEYDAAASFSNLGSCIDLFAPGTNVNGFTGTSASAPLVAGAAAVYLGTAPNATPATVAGTLINNATTNRLTGTGPSPNRLLFVPPGGTEIDQFPAGSFTCTCNGTRTCSFNVTTSDDFGVQSCKLYLGDDHFNRPIYRYTCSTLTYTYPYSGPYGVELLVTDDAGQIGSSFRFCQ